METKVPASVDGSVRGKASGRTGDYSRSSAIFVGVYQREGESIKRASVYSMIDEANKWNSPHPKFTASGGGSPEVLHHLRHIFYKHQTVDQNRVIFTDDDGNRLILFLLVSADVRIGTEDSGFESGVVVSFKESDPLFQDLLLLCELINSENIKNPARDPLGDPTVREHLKSVNLFP